MVWSIPSESLAEIVIVWFPGAREVVGVNDQLPEESGVTWAESVLDEFIVIFIVSFGGAVPSKFGVLSPTSSSVEGEVISGLPFCVSDEGEAFSCPVMVRVAGVPL